MRVIKFSTVYNNSKENTYDIVIYWNNRQSYSNLVRAKAKLVELGKKYTKILAQLNELFVQAHSHIQRFVFDFDAFLARKFQKLMDIINNRIEFCLNKRNPSCIVITGAILYIGFTIHELITLALINISKLKYTGTEVALQMLASQTHDLLFKFRIDNKLESFEPQLFMREYETKLLNLVA
ncbi:MAG: hypothetical protein ACKVOU_03595 [Cytophagales bacterium]